MNYWNTKQPRKHIDFLFKIDQHKKHLLQLKQTKSTFKKCKSLLIPLRINSILQTKLSSKDDDRINSEIKQKTKILKNEHMSTQGNNQMNNSHSNSMYRQLIHNRSNINNSILSQSITLYSPNKQTKFRNIQIQQNNKKLLKKIQSIRPTHSLAVNNLTTQFLQNHKKVQQNLKRTKYKHIDFTEKASQLIKGEKIMFQRINKTFCNENKKSSTCTGNTRIARISTEEKQNLLYWRPNSYIQKVDKIR